jgi:hypothetical protein
MSRDRNAGWDKSLKIDNSSIESVEYFKETGNVEKRSKLFTGRN